MFKTILGSIALVTASAVPAYITVAGNTPATVRDEISKVF